ncbi:VOC family protein [Eubacteriaceae bacterium ES2]|nr:VOC family protein [Eubacteriaceae bacterium ES2]
MNLGWVTINVKNMDESLKFFTETVGMALNHRQVAGPSMELAFLGDGETQIELVCNQAISELKVGKTMSLGFEVDSVDEKIAALEAQGIKILEGPIKPNPHIQFFFVLDPNGYKIQFFENL